MKLIVIGTGGHARAVISVAKTSKKWTDIYLLDTEQNVKEEQILDCKIIGTFENIEEFDSRTHNAFVAIGDNKKREDYFLRLKQLNFEVSNLKHANAFIDEEAYMGEGNFFGAFVNIGPSCKIGDGNLINTSADLEHEVTIGNFNQLGPSAVVCGRGKLGNRIFVGANAVLLPKVSITSNVTIGAGAVILNDIDEEFSVHVGIPGVKK